MKIITTHCNRNRKFPDHYKDSIPLSELLILFRVTGRWSRSQLTLGEGGSQPGQVASPCQGSFRDRQPFTPTGNLDSNSPACIWTVGGSQRTQKEPTLTRGEHAHPHRRTAQNRDPSPLAASRWEATLLLITTPLLQTCIIKNLT